MSGSKRVLGLIVIALLVGASGFWGLRYGRSLMQARNQVASPTEPPSRAALPDSGSQLVLVYIGAKACPWSNAADLPSHLNEIRRSLQSRADQAGIAFTSVGIARDEDEDAGMSHLAKFGHFDEIDVGGGWYSLGAQHYVHGVRGGLAATPQVLVVERVVRRRPFHEVGGERVIARHVGLGAIRRWAGAGAPIFLEQEAAYSQ